MRGRPLLRLIQRLVVKQQSVGAMLLIPQGGLPLRHAEMFLKPCRIIGADRLDQAVVREFVPCRAAPVFGADEMRIYQRRNRRVLQSLALFDPAQDLAANPLLRNQLRVEPGANLPLSDAALLCRCVDAIRIIPG